MTVVSLDKLKKELRRPIIVAHRGYAKNLDFNRNSLASFKEAIDLGTDAIECDLRITKDKQVIIHHNPWVRNEDKIKLISQNNYKDILKVLNDNSDVPKLSDLLNLNPKNIIIFFQIKRIVDVEPILKEMITKNYKMKNHIIMGYIRRIFDNNMLNEFNIGKHYILPNSLNLKIIDYYIKNKNINCRVASPSWNFITQRHINEIHKRKLNSVIYSVNNQRMFNRLKNYDVDAIYTSNLKKIMEKLN